MALTYVNQERAEITAVKTIAERLKDAREAAGLSQADLARASGVKPGTIGNIEAGTRQNPRELLAIAAAVKVRPLWLKSGKGPREVEPAEPPMPPLDDLVSAVVTIMRRLPREDQQAVLTHAVSMLPEPVEVEADR